MIANHQYCVDNSSELMAHAKIMSRAAQLTLKWHWETLMVALSATLLAQMAPPPPEAALLVKTLLTMDIGL
jgi:hypothetical protein